MAWKRKPYWSWGRWLHFGWAVGIIAFGFWAFGDPGLAWATVAVVFGGMAWEMLNALWPVGGWMFSDVVDFVFFVLGAAATDFAIIVYTGGLQ